MEEVVGSIPTRSINSLNDLDRAGAFSVAICVAVCVVTHRFDPRSQRFLILLFNFVPCKDVRRAESCREFSCGHSSFHHSPAFALFACSLTERLKELLDSGRRYHRDGQREALRSAIPLLSDDQTLAHDETSELEPPKFPATGTAGRKYWPRRFPFMSR